MKRIKINLKKVAKDEIDLIINYFKRGKAIVYPTDTVYGLGCLATDVKAIKKIYAIKKRDKDKPLLILVKDIKMMRAYCFLSKEQENFIKKARLGEKPVSFVLKKRSKLPKELSGGQDSIAVRFPDLLKNHFLTKILEGAGSPIVSTSFNVSGRKILNRPSRLENYFTKEKPDLVIDVGTMKAKPSRLIDIRDLGDIKTLRK